MDDETKLRGKKGLRAIDVTPEMIEAGLSAFYTAPIGPPLTEEEGRIVYIYRKMTLAGLRKIKATAKTSC